MSAESDKTLIVVRQDENLSPDRAKKGRRTGGVRGAGGAQGAKEAQGTMGSAENAENGRHGRYYTSRRVRSVVTGVSPVRVGADTGRAAAHP